MKPFDKLTERGRLRRLRVIAQEAVQAYNLQIEHLRFLTVATNTMFRVDTVQGDRYVLRIYSEGESTLDENLAEMFWLEAILRDTSLQVCVPVLNLFGEYITVVNADGVPGDRRCALFRWVPGRELHASISPQNYEKLGQIMAQLHNHAETLHPPSFLRPKRWDKVFYYPDEPVIYNQQSYSHYFTPERIQLLDTVYRRCQDFLAGLYTGERRPIWIHGDLHYWNVHIYRGRLIVIDFEDIMQGFPIQDIAVTLYYGRDREDYPSLWQAFQNGYSSLRAWPVDDENQLETLWAARSLNFINYVARIDPDPSEYLDWRCQQLETYLQRTWNEHQD